MAKQLKTPDLRNLSGGDFFSKKSFADQMKNLGCKDESIQKKISEDNRVCTFRNEMNDFRKAVKITAKFKSPYVREEAKKRLATHAKYLYDKYLGDSLLAYENREMLDMAETQMRRNEELRNEFDRLSPSFDKLRKEIQHVQGLLSNKNYKGDRSELISYLELCNHESDILYGQLFNLEHEMNVGTPRIGEKHANEIAKIQERKRNGKWGIIREGIGKIRPGNIINHFKVLGGWNDVLVYRDRAKKVEKLSGGEENYPYSRPYSELDSIPLGYYALLDKAPYFMGGTASQFLLKNPTYELDGRKQKLLETTEPPKLTGKGNQKLLSFSNFIICYGETLKYLPPHKKEDE